MKGAIWLRFIMYSGLRCIGFMGFGRPRRRYYVLRYENVRRGLCGVCDGGAWYPGLLRGGVSCWGFGEGGEEGCGELLSGEWGGVGWW